MLRWPIVLAFVLLAFNLLYLYAPNVQHWDWHWLMPGTVVGVGIWLLGSLGLKIYVANVQSYGATYGSIGAVVVLLLWFYVTGIAILVGGEVNSEIERASDEVGEPEDGKPRISRNGEVETHGSGTEKSTSGA
jgi:membrane protein